ncbi:nucleoside triphosphate hydrolase [Rubellimicrobium aerolatum]|uniref:Nucleoside triphosphate hydrolase n=1 Tax=Rubellimicrobium aerolatum TaxID=490979 RepID=A0ABW0S9T1_9RHOB|nr:nucleoside triphosphate hydrolase [Rubellimicrobium aerolatum]MBP1805033.1 pantothenate kinase [Rubellimicrobium aerolatum]
MTTVTDPEALARHLAGLSQERRVLCAIAGAPGSGKSTLAEALVGRLNADAPGQAALLPMDGFHYDDLYLVPAGLRPRKGAPETFDVGGLRHTLLRLRANDEDAVAVPVFDRDLEIARAGARLIPASVRIIVAEGNYLLLDRAPWDGLRPLFDATVMIEVPEAELRARLTRRWEQYRLTPEEIAWKLDGNDLPNGRAVRDGSVSAQFVIRG